MLTKCRNFEKDITEETIVFEKGNLIKIFKHINGGYGFEIKNKVFTSDIMEGVSYLMKNPLLYNKTIWDLPIEIESNLITPASSLYWLSGGDEFWDNPDRDLKWTDHFQIYLDKYESILKNILLNVSNLGELKKEIQIHLNLDSFYEFALENNII